MGRAARRRAEQRTSATAKVFPPTPGRRAARIPTLSWPAREGLAQLQELAQARAELDAAITSLVDTVAKQGASWGAVGRALGLTRQGARQRYGSRHGDPAGAPPR